MNRSVTYLACLITLCMSQTQARLHRFKNVPLQTLLELPEIDAENGTMQPDMAQLNNEPVNTMESPIPDLASEPQEMDLPMNQSLQQPGTVIDQAVSFTDSKPSQPFERPTQPTMFDEFGAGIDQMIEQSAQQQTVLPVAPLQTVEAQTVESFERIAGAPVARIMEPVVEQTPAQFVQPITDDSITRLLDK